MPKIGDELRAARQARHLSLSEAAEQLHIRSVYLEALEDERWAAVGAPVYVRGFLRTYARFLGLEPEPAVLAYNETLVHAPAAAPERRRYSPGRSRRATPSPWLWLAALAAAILVGFVGYNVFELRANHRLVALAGVASEGIGPLPSTQTAAVVPAPAAAVPHEIAAAARRTLEVRLTETTWLLVDIDGEKRLEGTFPPGTRKNFHGKLAEIRTGNAGGVRLTVNGKQLGTMGHPGGVVQRRVALDEE